ncbi:hypothetical protein ASPWEDRAFT_26255 [Aspergillus wentii DTO 134E9]|uniref:Uncharacterized protein n=1 Tax=Aspergillus wentii DTO 134E9 TaxID=1073089 RepID=A0A1L9RPF4_ASPWE|nr:uncharacterized protein ASPWEDRAFT_26255 [Aspergillus wentii DTO 134E9]KAI9924149.1 hypothetical protein MW887_007389 [Aspergillus wentii]OJJ36804.1 hypothetical protein ASPWEDRAFT_26255 [Aspergillus wentii DTO 134E9]
MPIKLPKGFTRRKSSGNVLDEVENPPQSSFRVFDRTSGDRKSFSDVNLIRRSMTEGHPYSPTEDSDNIFAPSEKPQSKNRGGDENSPSVRFSTSSDAPRQGDAQSTHSRNLHDIPIPPLTGALRAATRTFSLGGRLSRTSTNTPPPQKSAANSKNSPMEASTASTPTPPKLLDADLNLGKIDNDFQNMLNDFGQRENMHAPSTPDDSTMSFRKDDKASRPAPINTDRSREVEPSPYSWDSRHSEEGLLNTYDSMPTATTAHRSLEKPKIGNDRGLRRSVMYSGKRASTTFEDDDSKLIMESLYSKGGSQLHLALDHDASDAENETPLFGNGKLSAPGHSDRRVPVPIRAHKSPGPTELRPDPSIAAHARLAARYEQSLPKTNSSNKIMTPSQFEHYRQQQELRRSNSNASKSEDSAESEFDEEDETEKNREAERQRRKQEAHLSVYRQQMMKVTGQKSPAPSLRPEMDRASSSTPNLTTRSSNPEYHVESGKSSDGGDEDEEIPLGILAAHGFPNRNRPPTRLTSSTSIPNLRASYQPYVSSPGSGGSAENDMGNRGSLPAFARNLPRDPYYGASLVNPSNREPLALGAGAGGGGGGGTGSVHGAPASSLPPGGLVGVIATEERARAMRRGSPNTQAVYDYQGAMPGVAPHGSGNGIPRPYTMMNLNPPNTPSPQPALSATEHAQIQLSQQMAHMMQMQMQWMQQIVQIQGGQGPPQPHMPKAFPTGLAANTNSRPASMPSAAVFNNTPGGHYGDQRTLSMLDPNASSRLNGAPMPYLSAGDNRPGTPAGQGYAPSIAPSERSNVGMAPRYRPVSTLHAEQGHSFTPSMSGPWNDENQKPTISVVSPSPSHLSKTPPMSTGAARPISSGGRSTMVGKQKNRAVSDDEDDDEAWAEMMKRREKKKNDWKTKKETSNFGDLLNVVH